MGRRALRKIDPELDLSRHYFELDQLEKPLPVARLLADATAPLEIEVGSGKGLFLESATAEYPGRNFVGVEIARKYARFAAARLASSPRPNGVVIGGDAMRLFDEYIPAATLSAIHVYFPDPWWKKRHRKRRIMNERFLGHVARTLAPGGMLHFWTDVQEYFDTSLELIDRLAYLEGPFTVEQRAAGHSMDYQTHFERRMRIHQVEVYRAQFRQPC